MDEYTKELKRLYMRAAKLQGMALSGGARRKVVRRRRIAGGVRKVPKKMGYGFYKGDVEDTSKGNKEKAANNNPWIQFLRDHGKQKTKRSELGGEYNEYLKESGQVRRGRRKARIPAGHVGPRNPRYRFVPKNAKRGSYNIEDREAALLNSLGSALSGGARVKRAPSQYNLFVREFARLNPGLKGKDVIIGAAKEWKQSH